MSATSEPTASTAAASTCQEPTDVNATTATALLTTASPAYVSVPVTSYSLTTAACFAIV